MIINSASDVIYNGASVQSLYYNGRQVWPVTKSAVSLTLRHNTRPTSASTTVYVTAHDPYTDIDMYGSLHSSISDITYDYVPMNSNLTIAGGAYCMYYVDGSAHYGPSMHIKANRDLDVSAKFLTNSKKLFTASGYVYPISSMEEVSAQSWRLPLVVTYMSGCVWSAARTGLAEYTDLDGNVHSSSVPCSWIYCPDDRTDTLYNSSYYFSIRHTSIITRSPSPNNAYGGSVRPFLYLPEMTASSTSQSSVNVTGWDYAQNNPPSSISSLDAYWYSHVANHSSLTSSATVYPGYSPYSNATAIRTFGAWFLYGEWK